MREAAELFVGRHAETVHSLLFFGTVAAVAMWESFAPLRPLTASLRQRWLGNGALLLLNSALAWLFFRGLAVGVAVAAEREGWGVLNWTGTPFWPSCILGFLLLDLGRYAEHYLMHRLSPLWRLHRTHHTDTDFDVSTAVRFHPGEALLTGVDRIALIVLLGVPALAVLAFELVAPSIDFWVHGNLRLPPGPERVLRWVVQTPDMHRVHHSADPREQQCNLSAIFSVWDRLFGTYADRPAAGALAMRIGVTGFEAPRHLSLSWMLRNPALSADEPGSRGAAAHAPPNRSRGAG